MEEEKKTENSEDAVFEKEQTAAAEGDGKTVGEVLGEVAPPPPDPAVTMPPPRVETLVPGDPDNAGFPGMQPGESDPTTPPQPDIYENIGMGIPPSFDELRATGGRL